MILLPKAKERNKGKPTDILEDTTSRKLQARSLDLFPLKCGLREMETVFQDRNKSFWKLPLRFALDVCREALATCHFKIHSKVNLFEISSRWAATHYFVTYLSLVDFKQGGTLGMAKYQRPGRSLEAYNWWCPAFHPTFASGSLWKCSLLYFCIVLQDALCLDDVRATHIYTCMCVCATFLYSYTRSQTFIHVTLNAQTHLVHP